MGPHFMLLLSIYVLYSNVTYIYKLCIIFQYIYIYIYIYPVSCHVEIKMFQIVSDDPIFALLYLFKKIKYIYFYHLFFATYCTYFE